MDTRARPEAYAVECRRLAARAKDPVARSTFLQAADGWDELAKLHRRLMADRGEA